MVAWTRGEVQQLGDEVLRLAEDGKTRTEIEMVTEAQDVLAAGLRHVPVHWRSARHVMRMASLRIPHVAGELIEVPHELAPSVKMLVEIHAEFSASARPLLH